MIIKIKKISFFLSFAFFTIISAEASVNFFDQPDTTGTGLFTSGFLRNNNGYPDQALDAFKKVIAIRKGKFGEKDWFLATVYNSMGVSYKNLLQLDNAIASYKKSEELFKEFYGSEYAGIGMVLQNLANIFRIQGNYYDAIEYQKKSIEYLKKDMKTYGSNLENAHYNLSNLYFEMNNFSDAIRIINANFKNSSEDVKYNYYNLLSKINVIGGDKEAARKNILASINLLKTEFPDRFRDLALQYLNFADFLINEGEFQAAMAYLKNTEELSENKLSRNLQVKGSLYELYGTYYIKNKIISSDMESFRRLRKNQMSEGINYYFKILGIAGLPENSEELNNADLKKCIDIKRSLRILSGLGEVYYEMAGLNNDKNRDEKIETLRKSLICFEKASELIQFVRAGFVKTESKDLMSKLQQPIFYNLNGVAFDLYQLTNDTRYFDIAFQNTERNKATSLDDILSERSARETGLIPDSLNSLETDINSRLVFYNEKLFNEKNAENPDDTLIVNTEKLIFNLERDRDNLIKTLENQYSEYYKLKYSKISASLESITKEIGRKETLIEYSLQKSNDPAKKSILYIFCISRDGHRFEKQEIDSAFFNNLKTVINFIARPDFIFTENKDISAFKQAAYQLYNQLIKPVNPLIIEKKITIIPDKELSYLPFDVLLTSLPGGAENDLKSLPYLIRDYTVNYIYSANLQYRKSSGNKGKNGLIAFAPDYSLRSSTENTEWNQFLPIPGIKMEVNLIRKRIKTVVFEDDSATELNFREKAPDYDIIHLAMHTHLNDSLPMFSKLAFAPNPQGSLENDGWINTADIYNFKLSARMVVLSACNTGGGQLRDGEGVISLARGFSYAGCSSVVMTLWEIQDRSGTEIMGSFYRNLKNGKPKDDALRLAKLRHLEQADPLTSHPHYWLGYVTIGNPEPLFRDSGFYFYLILMIILIILVADQIVRYKKARKSGQF